MAITSTGTQLTFNDATVQTTAFTGAVTSVATGNGLQGGTITSTGTLSVACPTQNTVGSYCAGFLANGSAQAVSFGTNYAAGTGNLNMQAGAIGNAIHNASNSLSGTWKWLGATAQDYNMTAVACRVA